MSKLYNIYGNVCGSIIFIFLIVVLVSVVSATNNDVSCFYCHSKEKQQFLTSVHGNNISCIDCHGGNDSISAVISTGAMNTNDFTVKASVDKACKCHGNSINEYKESIHYSINTVSCTDCHGIHDIKSSIGILDISLICANCHENQTKMNAWYYGIKTDRYDTYKHSYHYKALISGGSGLATCPDCHENHNTKAENNPESSIYPVNLPATCGKPSCHVIGEIKINGKVHEGQSVYISKLDVKKLVTYFYIIMIIFELTFTFGLIVLDMYSKYDIRKRD